MTHARRFLYWLMLALLALIGLFYAASSANAEELKWRIASYIAMMDMKPVGDVEGHVTGPYVRRGLAFFPNGDIGVWTNTGMLDMTRGRGTATGTTLTSFDDGSTIATSFVADFAPGADGRPVYRMTGELTGGSGRFAGIQGRIASMGRAMTPMAGDTRSDAYFDVTATYTLPKP
jgi:hypothetical protein